MTSDIHMNEARSRDLQEAFDASPGELSGPGPRKGCSTVRLGTTEKRKEESTQKYYCWIGQG